MYVYIHCICLLFMYYSAHCGVLPSRTTRPTYSNCKVFIRNSEPIY